MDKTILGCIANFGIDLAALVYSRDGLEIVLPKRVFDQLYFELNKMPRYKAEPVYEENKIKILTQGGEIIVHRGKGDS